MSLAVDIEKRLGDFHLRVRFEAENEVMGLLGASGCGKSTVLRCIAGVMKPDRGRIVLDGTVLFDSERHIDLPPQKRGVGLLFQNYALFPNMTMEQNILCGLHGEKDKAARQAALAGMLERLRLQGLEKHRVSQLSGGQQQRVALARILVGKPRLLMLDEPFSALDGYLRWQVELELTDLFREYGGTVLLVSHSRDEVYRLCGSVCVMEQGRSEEKVPTAQLFQNPGTRGAALISGCKNYAEVCRVQGSSFLAREWGVRLDCGRPVPPEVRYVGIRSHYVRPAGGDEPNAVDCRIDRVIDDVFGTVVMLRPENAVPGADGLLRMELAKSEWAALGAQQRLRVTLAPADLLLLR